MGRDSVRLIAAYLLFWRTVLVKKYIHLCSSLPGSYTQGGSGDGHVALILTKNCDATASTNSTVAALLRKSAELANVLRDGSAGAPPHAAAAAFLSPELP